MTLDEIEVLCRLHGLSTKRIACIDVNTYPLGKAVLREYPQVQEILVCRFKGTPQWIITANGTPLVIEHANVKRVSQHVPVEADELAALLGIEIRYIS